MPLLQRYEEVWWARPDETVLYWAPVHGCECEATFAKVAGGGNILFYELLGECLTFPFSLFIGCFETLIKSILHTASATSHRLLHGLW